MSGLSPGTYTLNLKSVPLIVSELFTLNAQCTHTNTDKFDGNIIRHSLHSLGGDNDVLSLESAVCVRF